VILFHTGLLLLQSKNRLTDMNISTTFTSGLFGIDGYSVTVECAFDTDQKYFEIVGLPDNAVKESRQRIITASQSVGIDFESAKIVYNLAPADRRKEGSALDLAMTVALWRAAGIVPDPLRNTVPSDWFFNEENEKKDKNEIAESEIRSVSSYPKQMFVGELSFSGEIRGVRGVISMAMCAKNEGYDEIFVPSENAAEAAAVGGITVYPVPDLNTLRDHLLGHSPIHPQPFTEPDFGKIFDGGVDFSEVKGQVIAKRAVEIAVCGGHNLLMVGTPGSGKSMLAKRIPTIMPPLSFDEAVEITRLHSVSGILPGDTGLVQTRPFRSPHHTMSAPSLVGGGAIPMPGEVSLATGGVLFLDELPEFPKNVTDSMRQPIEDGHVTITRTQGRVTYPSSFMLVCAMNPCRCGYFGSDVRKCTCKRGDIEKYLSKISGPLLDRIDIQIEVRPLGFGELSQEKKAEPSEKIRERVMKAREIAEKRTGKAGFCNAKMDRAEIAEFCKLDESGIALMKNAFEKMGLSARGYDRILRVARTVADLSASESITPSHVAEAIQLRALDTKYFGR